MAKEFGKEVYEIAEFLSKNLYKITKLIFENRNEIGSSMVEIKNKLIEGFKILVNSRNELKSFEKPNLNLDDSTLLTFGSLLLKNLTLDSQLFNSAIDFSSKSVREIVTQVNNFMRASYSGLIDQIKVKIANVDEKSFVLDRLLKKGANIEVALENQNAQEINIEAFKNSLNKIADSLNWQKNVEVFPVIDSLLDTLLQFIEKKDGNNSRAVLMALLKISNTEDPSDYINFPADSPFWSKFTLFWDAGYYVDAPEMEAAKIWIEQVKELSRVQDDAYYSKDILEKYRTASSIFTDSRAWNETFSFFKQNVIVDTPKQYDYTIADMDRMKSLNPPQTWDNLLWSGLVTVGSLLGGKFLNNQNLNSASGNLPKIGFGKCGTCNEGSGKILTHDKDPSDLTCENCFEKNGKSTSKKYTSRNAKIIPIEQSQDPTHKEFLNSKKLHEELKNKLNQKSKFQDFMKGAGEEDKKIIKHAENGILNHSDSLQDKDYKKTAALMGHAHFNGTNTNGKLNLHKMMTKILKHNKTPLKDISFDKLSNINELAGEIKKNPKMLNYFTV